MAVVVVLCGFTMVVAGFAGGCWRIALSEGGKLFKWQYRRLAIHNSSKRGKQSNG